MLQTAFHAVPMFTARILCVRCCSAEHLVEQSCMLSVQWWRAMHVVCAVVACNACCLCSGGVQWIMVLCIHVHLWCRGP